MNTKHTSGEWELHPQNAQQIIGGGKNIARVSAGRKERMNISDYQYLTIDNDLEEIKANAKLIVSAPALLKFAQNIINALDPRDIDYEEGTVGRITFGANNNGVQDKSLDKAIIEGIKAIKKAN